MDAHPVRVFYSYSHSDAEILVDLRKHLAVLRRRGLITEWFDREIEAGSEWHAEISRELESADLIVLLVSSDFLDSDFCYQEEMVRALERSDRREARVIAVLARPVDGWESTPFAKLQVVPSNAVPISRWPDQDEALADVASMLRKVVERLRAPENAAGPAGLPTPSVETAAVLESAPEAAVASQRAEIQALLDELRGFDDAFLIINADPTRNYYTQYSSDGDGLWCEAVSNQCLQPGDALGPEQMAHLAELGWNPPEENLVNWWWPATQETPTTEIAELTLRTLTSVYGVNPEETLNVEKSWEN